MAKKNQSKVSVNTNVNAEVEVDDQLNETSEVEAVTPPKVLGKIDLPPSAVEAAKETPDNGVKERRKSSWATIAQAKSEAPAEEKINPEVNKIVTMTSFYVFFLIKTYCSNHSHNEKAVVEANMTNESVETLKLWRDFLFQKVSYLQEKENSVTGAKYPQRTLNTTPPEWSDIPASLQKFIDDQLHQEYNILMLAKQLTQAMPSRHVGDIQFSSTTVNKIIKTDDRYCRALCWWADCDYPNLEDLVSHGKKEVLLEMYENRCRFKWWSAPGEVLRFADQPSKW